MGLLASYIRRRRRRILIRSLILSAATMENNNGTISKKTLGRRKIEIKKIEKKTSLQVTFTKRRMGLFRKASELSVLCGAEIAILVQSPADKIFSFGHPSVEALLHRFHSGGGESAASSLQIVPWAAADDGRSKYEEAVRRLEFEKRSILKHQDENWWDKPLDDVMELHELEEFVEAMEALRNNVSCRLEEMSSTWNRTDHYNNNGVILPLQAINHQDFYGGKRELEISKDGIGGSFSTSADDNDAVIINCDDLFGDDAFREFDEVYYKV